MVEKLLPLKTKINGFAYSQVQRDRYRAIYAQEITPTRTQYEVFRIKSLNPKNKLANLYAKQGKSTDLLPDKAERFPYDEDFGKSAWSCRTLEEAAQRYESIAPSSLVQTEKSTPV